MPITNLASRPNHYHGDAKMKVTLTSNYKRVVFTWNAELTEVGYVGVNASDDEVNGLLAANTHEGVAVSGWETVIE